MSNDILAAFVSGIKNSKTGGIITTVKELRENQFGFTLKHYSQQYLFGATGLRIQVFNSIQGDKEVGKSTFLYDLFGDVCADADHGGMEGIGILYELEEKVSPSILYSILKGHGDRAVDACITRMGLTLDQAMEDLNKTVLPMYKKICPKRDKPLLIGFDSIGGAASEDTVDKLEKEGLAGKGFLNKPHFMKYFCENQGLLFSRDNIPVVVVCINQEKEDASSQPGFSGPPKKHITGGKSQAFKSGHMISVTKQKLGTGDGNIVTMRTAKTSYCDPRKIDVQFRWNKYGQKVDDAYEAKFLWALASAKCIADPEKGVGDIRSICDVKISDKMLVTCPQLNLKSVEPEEFEAALFENKDILQQLYTYQKIEQLRDLSEYPAYVKGRAGGADEPEETPAPAKPAPAKSKPKAKPKAKPEEPEVEVVDMMDYINKEQEA